MAPWSYMFQHKLGVGKPPTKNDGISGGESQRFGTMSMSHDVPCKLPTFSTCRFTAGCKNASFCSHLSKRNGFCHHPEKKTPCESFIFNKNAGVMTFQCKALQLNFGKGAMLNFGSVVCPIYFSGLLTCSLSPWAFIAIYHIQNVLGRPFRLKTACHYMTPAQTMSYNVTIKSLSLQPIIDLHQVWFPAPRQVDDPCRKLAFLPTNWGNQEPHNIEALGVFRQFCTPLQNKQHGGPKTRWSWFKWVSLLGRPGASGFLGTENDPCSTLWNLCL